MSEIDLLSSLPKGKRNVKARENAKTADHIRISKEYGQMYFDGPREYGYGGYRYDGRWQPVAKDIISYFGLKAGDRVLDVGCAKGFLVKDLVALGIDAYGVDVSKYALMNCEHEVVGRLQIGNAESLPFPDKSFDAVLSINTIHNLSRDRCKLALQEIQRLAPGRGFVQIDSYRTEEQKKVFESWVLTAEFHDYPDSWIALFNEAGYTGSYYWTILDVD
jgi:ubiquinone/menaquinone biosynthesis C-methylase UbiE